MGLIQYIKTTISINNFIKRNNNKIHSDNYSAGVYHLHSNLSIDDIKFNNLEYRIHLYDDDEGLQLLLFDSNQNKIAVLECRKSKKDLKEVAETKQKFLIQKKKEERLEKEKQEDKKEQQKQFEEQERIRCEQEFERYKDFIISNGGSEEIINMPEIRNIIMFGIENGDPRLIMEGRRTIAYRKPNPDGTFDIGLRTNGPTVNTLYKMSYCNDEDPDHYIKLTTIDTYGVHYTMDEPIGDSYEETETKIVFLNKEGYISDSSNSKSINY